MRPLYLPDRTVYRIELNDSRKPVYVMCNDIYSALIKFKEFSPTDELEAILSVIQIRTDIVLDLSKIHRTDPLSASVEVFFSYKKRMDIHEIDLDNFLDDDPFDDEYQILSNLKSDLLEFKNILKSMNKERYESLEIETSISSIRLGVLIVTELG